MVSCQSLLLSILRSLPRWAVHFVVLPLLALPLAAQRIQPLAAGGVEVTPDGGQVPARAPNEGHTALFAVQNTGTFQYTFTLTCGRTGTVSGCDSDLENITLAAGASGNVAVSYTTGASTGAGTVTLTASRTGVSDQGSYNVTVAAAGIVVPWLVRPNVDNLDRGLCLTSGAGEAAGLSCGDLFLVHGMPSYRTLGRDRSIALHYNSASATGLTLLPSGFRLPHTIGRPASIRVILDVTGTGYKDSVTYAVPASPICGAGCSDSFQVVSGKNLAWANLATGNYPVTITFRSIYQTQVRDTTLTGSTLVLNRSGSEYGRGWGLLGVERLVLPSDSSQRVWVAGDGSMRVYHQGAGPTSSLLTASGLTNFSAANSVDGSLGTTAWTTSGSTPTTAYVQKDFGASTPKAVTTARLYADTIPNALYDVQYSSNGSAWTTVVAGFRPQKGWSSVVWSSVGAYRFWRLKVASSAGVSQSTIRELSFGSANNFYGAPGDAPDSLVRYSSGGALWYRRDLRHGASVVFDPQGRHRTTTNRVGAPTVFSWDSVNSRLLTITVPPDSGAARNYTFTWNGSLLLDSIRDPGGRGLKATITSGNLVKLREPAKLDSTRFAYDGRNVLVKRIATRQKSTTKGDSAVTTFTYANNARVTQIAIQADSAGTQNTVTTVAPWDEHGLTTMEKVDTAGFASRLDGPLDGISDAADIRVDRFGQARRTNHVGLGTVTIVIRDSVNSLPALPTEVRSPHASTPGAVGMITRMSWNPRGNLVQQRDSTTHLGADSVPLRVISYEYNDADALDSPSRVVDPRGRATDYSYNSMGLTEGITNPRLHKTAFSYQVTGPLKGVVLTITDSSVAEWQQSTGTEVVNHQVTSFAYDANGNTNRITSPVGAVSAYVVDGLGRITDVHGPDYSRVRMDYDTLNRVTRRVQYTNAQTHPAGNPLSGCVSAQVTCAAAPWSLDSLNATLETRFVVSPVGVDSVIDPRGVDRSYRYDAVGRLVREVDDTSRAKIATYATTGLLTSVQLRTGAVSTHLYDAYGRDTALIVPSTNSGETPGDTIRTTFDLLGRRLVVRNRIGTITRTYYADGSMRSQRTALMLPGQSNPTIHDSLYYKYDAAGARTEMRHAYHAKADTVDVVRYTYNIAGDLDSLIVTWGSVPSPYNSARVFRFTWDSLGRRRTVTYPDAARNLTVQYSYDRLGGLRRVASENPGDPVPGSGLTDLHDFTLTNQTADPLGRILTQEITCDPSGTVLFSAGACQGAAAREVNTSNDYNYLGALTRQIAVEVSQRDTMQYDASGNMVRRRGQRFTIGAGSNRLLRDSTVGHTKARLMHYDADGSRILEDPQTQNDPSWRALYYDGLGRTSGDFAFREVNGTWTWIGDEDECFWDPDGQLSYPCAGDWVLFDGPNVARAGGGSLVWHVVHGPGLDDPLVAFFRTRTTTDTWKKELYYVGDGQGREFVVADYSGAVDSTMYLSPNKQGWKQGGGTQSAQSFGASRLEAPDQNPLSFFRNRAYDQNTGRWTQEDPIGIAGGLNLYQFNGNNPVVHTDPFGLKECDPPGSCIAAFTAAGIGIGVTAGLVVAAPTGELASPVTVTAGAALFGAAGAITGIVYEARNAISRAAGKVVSAVTNAASLITTLVGIHTGNPGARPPKKEDPPPAPVPYAPPKQGPGGDPPKPPIQIGPDGTPRMEIRP